MTVFVKVAVFVLVTVAVTLFFWWFQINSATELAHSFWQFAELNFGM